MVDEPTAWDVFISHASEDKDSFVRPLATALEQLGVSVWYDEFSLRLGDSLSRSIDKGLTASSFGLVVISPDFIGKPWPEYELRGLVTRDVEEGRVILPIWHGVTRQQVVALSPPLADKVALKTEGLSAEDVAIQVLREVRPDLYAKHPRGELERLASGKAISDLQDEMDRTREELEETQEKLSEYRCPYCAAPLVARIHAPVDEEQKDWDVREGFECGCQTFGGSVERPCPADPEFPGFQDYELFFDHSPDEPHLKWKCYAFGKTRMARGLYLPTGYGTTKAEAEQRVRKHLERCAGRGKKKNLGAICPKVSPPRAPPKSPKPPA